MRLFQQSVDIMAFIRDVYSLPVGGRAGNAVHQSCGTQNKSPPGCHRKNVPGLLWLLSWSHSLTQLVTKHRSVFLVPNLRSCSDELGLHKIPPRCYWLLRQSLGWSGPAVQGRRCILQNNNNTKCSLHYIKFYYLN